MERRPRIDGHTLLAGVIGWPVAHSRSPLMHNFWLEQRGINGAYVPLPVAPGAFDVAVRGLQAAGFRGVNVTIPHKESAYRIVDRLDRSAQRSGSVNTLVFAPDGRIEGYSTDGDGFVANVEAHGIPVRGGRALLLGAGGAARAIAASLLDRGVDVVVANRTRARADALAAQLAGITVIDWAGADELLPSCRFVVNTTSIGMEGGADATLPLDLSRADAWLVVCDIVYVPRQTALLRQAAERGLRTVDGLGMLIHQAGLGFEKWFGATPDIGPEVEALLDADLHRAHAG
ncbi:shikimate 5-dehydrogenase [Komagataeibacter xylinus NBRC 13693]|uniref:Shikimate dehydrogenase (NADP(+)) n=1 Tax=Komagataeibacter xylinus NBRC 13693 TaxID=1234668 RepID=A0A0D6Q6C1_KOMXY|nr:shikimate dehydrogenase [Komagataeibacter xylinus]GAN98286.1 shikimate 5-dehydrogenase [Komagataeibacter xylinus NBRC 13693]